MNVEPVGEGFLQLRNVGHVGEHAQFDLRIIGRDQLMTRGCDKRGADLAPGLVAHGDVLQIGFGRGQAPGCGGGQRIAGVNALRARIHIAGQRIRIG